MIFRPFQYIHTNSNITVLNLKLVFPSFILLTYFKKQIILYTETRLLRVTYVINNWSLPCAQLCRINISYLGI